MKSTERFKSTEQSLKIKFKKKSRSLEEIRRRWETRRLTVPNDVSVTNENSFYVREFEKGDVKHEQIDVESYASMKTRYKTHNPQSGFGCEW